MEFPDPRFFRALGTLTAEGAADIVGATVVRGGDVAITTVAEAKAGGEGALIFAEKDASDVAPSAVALVPLGAGDKVPDGVAAVLEVASPKAAFAIITDKLFESRMEKPSPDHASDPQIDPSARVHPAAIIGDGAVIEANVVVAAGAVVGPGVVIGEGSFIGPGASVTHALIGKGCRISAGARIGECGFGYAPGPKGAILIPQLGRAVLHDFVDIGANSTVDRGMLGDTVIGAGTKIDNLCQVGHNCRLGRGVLMASLTGISGSCTIGDGVMMGGQVGMADHVTIGDGAILSARSGVMRDIEAGARVGGFPAKPVREWMRETAALGRLASKK
ncbi:MAG: UDP-3-O-(3-hydroxymyristoyl)glucosamine N-acyltransferase [Pseudomonadota bacterium]